MTSCSSRHRECWSCCGGPCDPTNCTRRRKDTKRKSNRGRPATWIRTRLSRQDDGPEIHRFRWLGSEAPHLDAPVVARCRDVVIGCYGGHAGADKNEDGALVWCAGDGSWEFAMLLDAHASAESAGLILAAVEAEERAVTSALSQPVETAFAALQECLMTLFRSAEFRARCRRVQGETACLICARKEQFLWWLSVGDCLVYLFHP